MKTLYLIIVILLLSLNSFAQTIRSETYIEGSPVSYYSNTDPENIKPNKVSFLDELNFEEKLYWRKRYDKEGQEKDSYWFHSVYLKDSMLGAKLIGIDFNFLHEKFEKNSWNKFRQWNCMRAGAALSIEYNPYEDLYPINESFKYINANIYFKFMHISKSSRGDKHTKYRRGTWGLELYRDLRKRTTILLRIKPLNFVWVNLRYKRNIYNEDYYALLFEWELNANGYNNCKVANTKDLYKGLSVFAGPEYNTTIQSFLLNIGLHFSYRNH